MRIHIKKCIKCEEDLTEWYLTDFDVVNATRATFLCTKCPMAFVIYKYKPSPWASNRSYRYSYEWKRTNHFKDTIMENYPYYSMPLKKIFEGV